MSSPFVSTWSLWRSNNFRVRLSKLLVSVATSILPSLPEKTPSTWEFESIRGTYSVSTKCFPVPELIDFRPVWEVLMESQLERLPEQTLVKLFFQFEQRMLPPPLFKKPSDDPSSNSLVAIKLLFPTNGDSHPWWERNTQNWRIKAKSSPMEPTARS